MGKYGWKPSKEIQKSSETSANARIPAYTDARRDFSFWVIMTQFIILGGCHLKNQQFCNSDNRYLWGIDLSGKPPKIIQNRQILGKTAKSAGTRKTYGKPAKTRKNHQNGGNLPFRKNSKTAGTYEGRVSTEESATSESSLDFWSYWLSTEGWNVGWKYEIH